ncbi:MAG: DMT family transporter [Alphaproteobacteria bacterium]|nr:DMT family transporter [Alphaproteobacteria bacterium]MBU1559423.1 DMT family transporter [Alphaproteobacteria bacterium]MBU2301475.1 DMT family transporter [Alphaproteobacteria bacterium]MBU2369359.1 DMT family transporter [Alphaproteobacteria bacterium]
MPVGVIYAVVAYSVYSCGDAIIKGFGQDLSVFEIGFFIAVFGLIPAAFAKPKGERWHDSFRLKHPFLVHLRSFTGVASAILVTVSFTTIPFAETYSLVFMMPLFITVMSVLFLKEKVDAIRWAMLALGFLGVMLVVRPGFRELELGHLTALLCAVFGASTTTILRVIAPTEKRVSLIVLPALYVIVINAVLMAPSFIMPTAQQFGLLAASGSMVGMGHILLIAATRNAPASQVAPIQYVQIVWAIGLGAFFYFEYPDFVAYIGLAVVVLSGLVNVFIDGARTRIAGRFAEYRARRPSSPTDITEVQGPEI